ncbi:MAG: CDP-alcohol phosphatidyltransferase family protein [Bacteroidales bacterium]
MQIKKQIPNIFTLTNLLSGSIAIVFAFEGLFHLAAIFLGLAAFFDFADGFAARALRSYSDIGKELDSMADMVSFGFTPAVVIFRLLQETSVNSAIWVYDINVLPFIAFFVTLFSALRLAIFNVDTRQSEMFIGLPTPANAILILSIPFAVHYGSSESMWHPLFSWILSNEWMLIGLTLFLSIFLVANVTLFSLKFKNLKVTDNLVRYVFLAGSAILLLFLHWFAIPLIMIFYITLSMADYLATKLNK